MNPYVYTYLMFFIQGLLESYFLCNYLKSENKKKAFILSQIILCLFQHPVQMWLFNIQGIKMILYILVLYMAVFICFPKNDLKKKLISVMILMLIIMFVEVLAISIIAFTIGLNEVITIENPHPLYVYIIQSIILFTVIKIALKFVDKQIVLSKIDYVVFFLISLLQVSFLFIFNINMSIKAVGVNPHSSWLLYLVLLALSIVLYMVVILYLVRRQKKKKQEVMLILLQKEYEEQLQYYMEQKHIYTDISMLRHDLINYIQSNILKE